MNDEKMLPDDPRITAYALGELEGESRDAVMAAVRKDSALQAVVAEISRFAGTLRQALSEETAAVAPSRRHRRQNLIALAGGVATAAALMLVALRMSRPGPTPAVASGRPEIPHVGIGMPRLDEAGAADSNSRAIPAVPFSLPASEARPAEERPKLVDMEEATDLSAFKIDGKLMVTRPISPPPVPRAYRYAASSPSPMQLDADGRVEIAPPAVLSFGPERSRIPDIAAKPFTFAGATPVGGNLAPLFKIFAASAPASTKTQLTFAGQSPASDSNRFALDLYRQLGNQGGNLFFSPYSISSALLMAYAGAGGTTEREMARVLHLTANQTMVAAGYSALKAQLAREEGEGITLSVANALWLQQGLHLSDSFREVANAHYGASMLSADFLRHPEAARLQINQWVERATNRRITDLVPPGGVGPATHLVLANAIYFKGTWASRFEPGATHPAPFFVGAGRDLTAPTMHQQGKFRLARIDQLDLLELPYAGGGISMIVLLPERGGLPDVEARLNSASLGHWLSALAAVQTSEVAVALPRFRTTLRYDLTETLAQLGMPSAFKGGVADFSGMDGMRDLYFSDVVHQAFVAVDEEGTEAAAATGAIMFGVSYVPAVHFDADHPFLFLIRENQTGTILFLGRITDPTKS